MNNKLGTLALAAMIGVGFASFQTQSASAAGPFSTQGNIQPAATESILQLAQTRQDNNRSRTRTSWNRDRDGRRCSRRSGDCRYLRNGFYYESPWWTLPLIIGGGIAAQGLSNNGGYNNYGNAHVQWCSDRYRSYNVRTNTWVAYSGAVRQCRSPY